MNKKIDINKLLKIAMIFSIVFGLIYIIRNLTYVPQYGDTVEYIELSQNFKFDGYRTFVFPLILKICFKLSQILNIQYTYFLYTIQNIISLCACILIVKSLYNIFERKINKADILLYSLFLWSTPFNIHFNMSVLSDSLAISFTVMFIASFMCLLKTHKIYYSIPTIIFMYLASNTRSEKVYFCLFVLTITLIAVIIKRRKDIFKEETIKQITAIVGIMIITLTLNTITKKCFGQNKEQDYTRTQPGFVSFLSQRVMKYNLPDMYKYFPEEVTRSITYEDTQNDGKVTYQGIYEKLLTEDGNNARVIMIIKTVLKHNWYNILLDINSDFIKNIFPTIYQLFETRQGAFEWTITRMQGNHPVYTTGYIIFNNLIYVIIYVILIFRLTNAKYKYDVKINSNLLPMILYILVNALFFTFLTSQNFHIRYAMPTYMMEYAMIIILLSLSNKKLKE